MCGEHESAGAVDVPCCDYVSECPLSYHGVLSDRVQLHRPLEVPEELGDVVPGPGEPRGVHHPRGQQRGEQRLELGSRTQ